MADKKIPFNPLEGDRPEMSINLHDGNEEHVSIIIVHKDRPEYLNILIQSIAVTSYSNNYEIIVVDNGSTTQEAIDYITDLEKEVKVVRNKENLYFSAAANKGVEAADKNSKYFIFMHYDVVITNPAWIDLLTNISSAHGAGIVGVELKSYFMQGQKVDYVEEWLMLISREAWASIGPWPEQLPQIGNSFIMTMKAQLSGFKPQVMRNPIAHHYRHFSLDISEFEKLTEKAMYTLPQVMREVQSKPVK